MASPERPPPVSGAAARPYGGAVPPHLADPPDLSHLPDLPDLPDTPVVAGIVEDERLRATVRTDGSDATDTVVTIEGSLESSTAPVLDELLGAVDRWQVASRRRAERARRPVPTTRLWLDASRVRTVDPAVRQVLDTRAARWRDRHGPCISWCGSALTRRADTRRPSP